VEKTVNDLTNIHLCLDEKDFPKALVGSHKTKAEILLRQILLNNHSIISPLTMRGIGSKKPTSFPLPKSWINSMESSGVNVNHWGSKIALYKFSVFCLFKGLAKTIFMLLQYKLPTHTGKPYVAFLNLTLNNLPTPGQKKSYDIISWYKQSKIKKPEVKEIWAQARNHETSEVSPDIVVCRIVFPRFSKATYFLKYFYKSFISFILAFTGMVCGKWWYGLLYEESAVFNYVSVLNEQDLAREYLFHNSNPFHKPLWSLEVEMKGSDVTLYYYSTNIDNTLFNGFQRVNNSYKIMRWKHFIVWDSQQKDFIKQFCPDAIYQIVGPIDISDNGKKIHNFGSGFKIAIFDVTPTRPVTYTSLGCAIVPYYSEKLSLQYFINIGTIFNDNKIDLLWKQKRIVGRDFISNGFLKKRDHIINQFFEAIDSEVSARRLINECDAIISMPFTSTSIIGKELGKPSIFYDASASIEQYESHGIPVLKSKDELKKWYRSLNL